MPGDRLDTCCKHRLVLIHAVLALIDQVCAKGHGQLRVEIEQWHALTLEACLFTLLLEEISFVLAHHLAPLLVDRCDVVIFHAYSGIRCPKRLS